MNSRNEIDRLREFKAEVERWSTARSSAERSESRTYINENVSWVRQAVVEAGCFHSLNISPPPMVGGYVMRGVDPFYALFDPPYSIPLYDHVIDMVERTIGFILFPVEKASKLPDTPVIESIVERNYAFIAMGIDPENHELEDVLDSIKEAAGRCDIQAERVDETHSNDRITDRILESIRKAEFVIVDLTYPKPNVFYEAGFAQGICKTPIFIARHGTRLEFDLKDYPVIFFRNMKQLKDGLEARLRALIAQRES